MSGRRRKGPPKPPENVISLDAERRKRQAPPEPSKVEACAASFAHAFASVTARRPVAYGMVTLAEDGSLSFLCFAHGVDAHVLHSGLCKAQQMLLADDE